MRNWMNSGSLKKMLCTVGGLLFCNAVLLVFLSNFEDLGSAKSASELGQAGAACCGVAAAGEIL